MSTSFFPNVPGEQCIHSGNRSNIDDFLDPPLQAAVRGFGHGYH